MTFLCTKNNEDMEIVVTYAEAIRRCKMLSAYEAKEAKDGSGESMYESIRIQERDEQVLKVYMRQAAQMLEAKMSAVIEEEGDYSDDGQVTWQVHEDASRRGTGKGARGFVKSAQEAFVVFAMSRWLENKLEASANSYRGMWNDLSEAAVRILKTKRKPVRPER